MSVTQKFKCYNLKIHSFTYRIRFKALFYSKWYSHNNELNTMNFHHPGHVAEILSKLRQISISVSIKTPCFGTKQQAIPLVICKIFFRDFFIIIVEMM